MTLFHWLSASGNSHHGLAHLDRILFSARSFFCFFTRNAHEAVREAVVAESVMLTAFHDLMSDVPFFIFSVAGRSNHLVIEHFSSTYIFVLAK